MATGQQWTKAEGKGKKKRWKGMDSNTGKRWTKETMDKGHHGGRRRLWTKETTGEGKYGERRAKQPMRRGDYDQKRQWPTETMGKGDDGQKKLWAEETIDRRGHGQWQRKLWPK